MSQVEQDYISEFLESLHPNDIDNRMCFKVFVNSFIEERELLLLKCHQMSQKLSMI